MDTLSAFAMGEMSRGNEMKVFDWEKAAKLIKEKSASHAEAGLKEDWEWTAGDIFENGKPVPEDETYTFLASTWATPAIEIDGEECDCYKMESEVSDWNEKTYWPESAIKIINEE